MKISLSIQDAVDEMKKNEPIPEPTPEDFPAIVGEIYPYDVKSYSIKNAYGWYLGSKY